jgi:hypothetical protein
MSVDQGQTSIGFSIVWKCSEKPFARTAISVEARVLQPDLKLPEVVHQFCASLENPVFCKQL